VATTGNSTTTSLADSLPTVIASARIVREYEGTMTSDQVVDKVTLEENTGTVWNEVRLEKLTATGVGETAVLNNPQQMSDTLLSLTPTVAGIHTVLTDRVRRRISSNVLAKVGDPRLPWVSLLLPYRASLVTPQNLPLRATFQ